MDREESDNGEDNEDIILFLLECMYGGIDDDTADDSEEERGYTVIGKLMEYEFI